MLQEEQEYFLVSERYVGNVKDPSMKIHLLDETSIQRNYNRVPKLLRQEIEMLRTYLIEVKRSTSNYSSLINAVLKQYGCHCLFCDYQQPNSNIRPNKHPLTNIQDSLNSLGGSSYFSVLD